MHAGADPEYRLVSRYAFEAPRLTFDKPISKYDNNPKNKTWDFILQGGLSRQSVETLSCLTEGSDFVDEQNYTNIRRIVLELSLVSLEEELAQHPEDIDAVDTLGRTPLIWAAAKGNDHAVA